MLDTADFIFCVQLWESVSVLMKVLKFVLEVSLATVSYFVICAFNKKNIHFAHDTEDNVYVRA